MNTTIIGPKLISKKRLKRKRDFSVLMNSNWKLASQNIGMKRKPKNYTHKKQKQTTIHSQYEKYPKSHAENDSEHNKIVAFDCEMVGVGPDGKDSRLARVCIINYNGQVLYESYSRPMETITDYRTEFSGIRKEDLLEAPSLGEVRDKILSLLKGKVVVGHSIANDFKVLLIRNHPRKKIRDTSSWKKFRNEVGRKQKLSELSLRYLKWKIQDGEHDPYIDARAALELYKKFRKEWESGLEKRRNSRKMKKKEGLSKKFKQTKFLQSAPSEEKDIFATKRSD
eukprot:snap_masked-scaffold_1-processed-gene-5.18-mRNA-1 protein AED:0.27 eAED:0.27 QI:0/-1/0/1/-1/1/1/0/281